MHGRGICPNCNSPVVIDSKFALRRFGYDIELRCGCGVRNRFVSVPQYLRLTIRAMRMLPYKRWWIAFTVTSFLCFGWYDEVLFWGLGIRYGFQITGAYYGVEYGLMVPLTIYLGIRTFRKLNLPYNPLAQLKRVLRGSLFGRICGQVERIIKKC